MVHVISVFPGYREGTFFIKETKELKSEKVFSSVEEASEILGAGVSLEELSVVREGKRDTKVLVYLSRCKTCCVLAKEYWSIF